MKQVEMLNVQDSLSVFVYEQYIDDEAQYEREHGGEIRKSAFSPESWYVQSVVDDMGYELETGQLRELKGDLLFMSEQKSAVLHEYYCDRTFFSWSCVQAVHDMADLALMENWVDSPSF